MLKFFRQFIKRLKTPHVFTKVLADVLENNILAFFSLMGFYGIGKDDYLFFLARKNMSIYNFFFYNDKFTNCQDKSVHNLCSPTSVLYAVYLETGSWPPPPLPLPVKLS